MQVLEYLSFWVLRRLGVAQWIACIPAAVPLLCGDQLFQEHTVMSDFLLTFLAIAGVCLAICGLVPQLHLGWLAVGSALLGAAGLTRNIGFALVAVLGDERRLVSLLAPAQQPGVCDRYIARLAGFRLLLERLRAGTRALPWIKRYARLEPLRTSGAIRRLR